MTAARAESVMDVDLTRFRSILKTFRLFKPDIPNTRT